MTGIRVRHPGADYEVVVGGLSANLPRIAALTNGERLPVVTDRRVFGLHGHLLGGLVSEPIFLPEGETAKDWDTLAEIIGALAARQVKRGAPIIAFGGGSVGDVAGLAASLFKRGCPVIHIATTLLAQVDSAIGGKTAIDAAGQKNLVGTFHHPLLVIADPGLLETLDQRQLRSGYAEVVKYGLIDNADFFAWCEVNGTSLLEGDPIARCAAVEHCIRTKARFVSVDSEDMSGTRALLNFGHTFGHAIEALGGTSILHGEAVATGMTLAFRFSVDLGLCPAADADRAEAHLQSVGLPTRLVELEPEAVFHAMQSDKKATASGLTLILTKGIGRAFAAKGVGPAHLAEFLARPA